MIKREMLHEGKVKSIWTTDDPEVCIAEFSDRITAGDGLKKAELPGKGVLLNKISSLLFSRLAEAGVPSHFIRAIDDNSMLVRKAHLLPLEVVVRNRTAGSICRRLGLAQNLVIEPPLVEFFWKNDALHDPLLTREHIAMLDVVSDEQYAEIVNQALAVNRVLTDIFAGAGLDLADFKLEFGISQGRVLIIDEISPDTCRLWLAGTTQGLDKDRFRNDTGDVLEGYREVLHRLMATEKTQAGGRSHE
jgi:phosphoribosylaminoimidazole-succinocarboxamide synthase